MASPLRGSARLLFLVLPGFLVGALHLVRGEAAGSGGGLLVGGGVYGACKAGGTRGAEGARGADRTDGAHEVSALLAKLLGHVPVLGIAAAAGEVCAALLGLLRNIPEEAFVLRLIFLPRFFIELFRFFCALIHIFIHKITPF